MLDAGRDVGRRRGKDAGRDVGCRRRRDAGRDVGCRQGEGCRHRESEGALRQQFPSDPASFSNSPLPAAPQQQDLAPEPFSAPPNQTPARDAHLSMALLRR